MFVDAPPSWDEIAKSQEFQNLTPNEKANVQRRWVFDRMNYDYDRGNEINQDAMVKEFKKNGFEPTVINTGFKDFTDYRSYMEGQQAEGLQGDAREEALSPNYSFGEGLLVGSQQAAGALGAGLVRPFEGMAGLADMTVGKALETVTGSRMGIDKLANNLHGIVAEMGRGVETDVIHGFSDGGFKGGVNALVNMVLMEAPNQIIQLGIGAAGVPQPYALAMLGASSMGSQYNDIKNDQSLSELQKYSIATLNGTIEGVTELMDSIPFIKRMTSSTKQAIFREALRSKPIRTMAKEFLKTFAGEAAEEATGEFLQNVSEAAIRGEKIKWKDLGIQVANAGIGGGAMGGMMGVGGVAYNRHADNERTSRKAFQEMKAMQAGFNPASKEFSRIAKSADLPEKYSTREGRRKAIDDYDFHGEPISFGKEVTDADRIAALKERIAWYDNVKDNIEDGDEKAEWDEYYKEWTEKLDALQNKKDEQLPPPVDAEGNELGAEEVTEKVTEEEPPTEKPEPPKEEKPAEEKPKEPPRWVAEHPNHEKSPGGHYEIVDANDILVSGDEGHLAIMQNRSEGAERTAQINDMSAHPNVSKMFTEGLTDEGAPIAVLRDGKLMVVSGNGRTKARRLMATRRTDMEYLNKLQQWANENGVEMPKGMQAPMLLRVIDENLNDEQLKDFVRQANMEGNDKLALDAAERSADDAVGMEKHGDKLIGLFTESEGDAIVSASNKEFVSKFRSLIGQRDGDVDSNGLPTSQFERRVANAFLGMLFKNMPVADRNDLLNNLINHGDKYNVVGVYRGLAKKAPKLIKLAQQNKAFALDDILPKALDALLDFKANREQFKNDPDMYLNQPMLGMDKRELKGDERDLFKILATAKYQSQMARVLQDYVDKARRESTDDLFGKRMNRGQLLQSVLAAEQARVDANGGAAVDAFLDNGSFDDAGMPTVEGARVVEEKKKVKRNPMLRGSVESEAQEQGRQAAENPVEDSFVEKISKAVKTVADGFGFNVVVHKNDADLPAEVQEDLAAFGEGTYAEAWVGSDGVVHLVASRLESSEAAVRKLLHEIVGHNGLAALFKGRNTDAWNDMVEKLWESYKGDILKRCDAYVGAEGFDIDTNKGRGNLVEEWLARLAETNRKPIWWKAIVSKVRALLRACGMEVAYSDADIQQLLADAATAARRAQTMDDSNVRFSIRKDDPPKKTGIGYKVFYQKDGKLYPPMIANPGGEDTPVGIWLDADAAPIVGQSKTGRAKVKQGGKGTQGGSGTLAYRPGWHLGEIPYALQFNRGEKVDNPVGKTKPVQDERFNKWFGDSQAVNGEGNPLVVYRRDNERFTVFDFNKTQKHDAGWLGKGFYFYGDKNEAERAYGYGQNLRAFYLKAENPYYISEDEYDELVNANDKKKSAAFTEQLIEDGYDSVYWNGDLRQEWVVFKPNQIKSATDNNGEYSLNNLDIRYSATRPVQDETSPIPQGPLPPIANMMRQRAAHSPISNLRAFRLPAMVMLGRELGGNLSAVDRIKRMPSASGVFRHGTREIEAIRSLVEPHQLGNQWVVPQGQEDQQAEMIKDYWAERGIPRDEIEIVMKTDEAAKEVTIKAIWHDKSQTLFKKVLGHEIGHLIDYNQGETTTHGNVLGTVGGMGYKYLRKIIGETPDEQIDFEQFEKRKKELHKQAEGLAGEKPKDADELKAWRETVKAEYANLLTSECEQNGWFQAAVIREELVNNTEWWSGEIGPDPNYRRYRTSPTELFAEAMSVLLNAPDKFAKQLPETWRMLQNYQKERPEFHKAWQGLMRMMNNEEAYTDALMKLAEEGFTADEQTEIKIEEERHDVLRALKRKLVDSFADVNDASKKLVREGKVTLDETPIGNIVSATHQSIKDYYLILAERLSKPLFDAGLTESDIGKYLEFQRIVNDPSINQGHIINPNGMTVNDAKDALAKLKRTLGKEKWELLDKWHKDFWQLRQETIIRLAEESGMYDKALIEHMKKNEWYSYRAVIEQIYNADGTEKRGMSKIYGLKGTLSPIANPLGWTYDHDMRLMGGILWNQARLKTIQFMKEQFPDLVNKVKKFGVVSNHAPDGFTRLAVLENGQYVEYDVAETWAKGFQSQLDRDTAAILEKAQWITNLYRRAWTTLSPTFLLNNIVRDYLASYQNLSGINRQIGMVEWTKCWMQGMKEAFKFQFKGESELIEGMMKSNMFQSGGKGYDMSGRSGELAGSRRMEFLRRYGLAEDEQIRRGAIARFTKYLSDHLGVTWLGDKLGKAVSATEMGAKAGGLIALNKHDAMVQTSEGMATVQINDNETADVPVEDISIRLMSDAEKQWHVVRHIGSPDFAQRGTATPIWNTVFIFSNAAIQGWNGTLEMAKANPKGFAARFMATTGMAVFIQWALESGALLAAVKGVMGDDDDEAKGLVALLDWIQKQYGRITHHNRYNYMCLPIAETDNGHCLAFRMPFAENSKLPAMMLHAALDEAYTKIKKDENFKTETGKAIANQAPNLNPVMGMTGDAFLMYVCGVNGYDKYRQRRAVRMKDWEAGGWRRFKGTTAYMVHEYTPFAIVNNMFDLRDNPYWWWNLIGALGPGAWFKFQQYGEAEQSRAVTAEKRRERLNGKAAAFYR